MSCSHGNADNNCELCSAVDAAWNSGYESGKKDARLEAEPAAIEQRDNEIQKRKEISEAIVNLLKYLRPWLTDECQKLVDAADALESADAEVERQKDAVSRFRGRAEAAEQSLASAEARIKEMTEIGVEVSREFIAAEVKAFIVGQLALQDTSTTTRLVRIECLVARPDGGQDAIVLLENGNFAKVDVSNLRHLPIGWLWAHSKEQPAAVDAAMEKECGK